MIDRFMEAVAELEGVSLHERHRVHRNAKLMRRCIEAGDQPGDAEWREYFPSEPIRELAIELLSEPPDVLNLDFEATWVGANAKAAKATDAVADAASEGVDLAEANG